MCDRTVELECGKSAAVCFGESKTTMGLGVCERELIDSYGCFKEQPASHWVCEEGLASMRDGHCDAEQRAFAECIGQL